MKRVLPILAMALLTIAVGTTNAGDHSNAKAVKATKALDGYCPVAYVAMGKAVKGDSKIWSDLDGHRYYFSNADAKKMFDAEPAKYRVGYDGYCATAVSMGKKLKSKPTLFAVHEGVTYLFSSADAKKMFSMNPAGVIEKADAAWARLNG